MFFEFESEHFLMKSEFSFRYICFYSGWIALENDFIV